MAGGFSSQFGSWLARLAAPNSAGTNDVSGAVQESADQFAGSLLFAAGGLVSHFGRWFGGFSASNLGSNALSGNVVENADIFGGLVTLPGVISGSLVENADTFAGLLFDPYGVIDTGFLFEAR